MITKELRQHAYQQLSTNSVHWTRLDPKTIVVYMPSDGNGSHHNNLDLIKTFLEGHGFFEFERDFDRQCGKGFSVFKESNQSRESA